MIYAPDGHDAQRESAARCTHTLEDAQKVRTLHPRIAIQRDAEERCPVSGLSRVACAAADGKLS